MRTSAKIGLGLVAAIGLIQFIHPERNSDAAITANHISNIAPPPADVQLILAKACNDCHSNNTVYPWYSKLQPVDWWLTNHINDGKRHLNFSEFGSYPLRRQYKKLLETAEEIEEGEMPLSSYTWIHKDAVLTPSEKEAVIKWARDAAAAVYTRMSPQEIEEMNKRKKR